MQYLRDISLIVVNYLVCEHDKNKCNCLWDISGEN